MTASHHQADPNLAAHALQPQADLVLRGGTILQMDTEGSQVGAIAVRAGMIVAAGSENEIARIIGPETKVIDLMGRTALPGINDGHLHAVWYGASWPHLMFESQDRDWHSKLIDTEEQRVIALTRAWAEMANLGITSYTEPGIGPGEDGGPTGCFGTEVFDTYRKLAGTAAQTARVTMLRLFGLLDGASNFAAFESGLESALPATPSHWLNVPGVKIFADGIPPMGTAWTLEPYLKGGHGQLFTGTGDEAERLIEFRKMIRLAHGRGLQIGVHATGDRTIEEFITAVEELGGAGDLGHYVIHGDLITPEQIDRLAATGMGIALQPLIAEQTADWMAQAVSADVAAQAWPLRALADTKVAAILSSDAPVASPDWRRIVASAARILERQGGSIDQAIMHKLLRMVTAIPAIQDQASDWKGTLEVGKVADICVLAANPMTKGAAALPDIAVVMTIVDGRVVYEAP